jgi:rod shape-determining protein MreB
VRGQFSAMKIAGYCHGLSQGVRSGFTKGLIRVYGFGRLNRWFFTGPKVWPACEVSDKKGFEMSFLKKLRFLSNDIAIDLGTANTLVYVKGEGIVLNEPSVVAVDKGTGDVLAVGVKAKEMLGRTPDRIVAVRPLKDGVIADFEKTEELLREFIKQVLKNWRLIRPRIMICVPSGITEVERRAVEDSALRAGAREVFLVKEPIAAAIGVGLPVDKPSGNMIIDIGGGTTEIAVMALDDIVSHVSIRIAGDEMDDAIVQHVKKAHNLLIGEQTAERVKIRIGSAFRLEKEEEMEIKGRDLVGGIPKTVKITSVEVREALQEPIGQIVDALKLSLEKTPPELASDIVDKGIVMTGGGSLLRGLDALLREHTNLHIEVSDEPLTCVVLGTGKILDNPRKYRNVIMKGESH